MQNIEIHMHIRDTMDDAVARLVTIGGLVAIALIHTLQTPDAFGEVGYLGGLFIAAAAAAVLVAAAITRTSDDRVFMAAGGLAGLILLGYIISRSVGLPGFTDDIGEWAEPPALVAMVVESLVIVLSAAVLVSRHQAAPREQRAAVAAPRPLTS